jgi:type 1 glutamine amidotransferase
MRTALFFLAIFLLFAPWTTAAELEPPLKIAISASKGQLDQFQKYLEERYHVVCYVIEAQKGGEITGVESLAKADVLLNNLYRTEPKPEQLEQFKKFFSSKKGLVGLRKASHSFQNWLEQDQIVLGAKYGGHFLLNRKDLVMDVNEKAKHCFLLGDLKPFLPGGGLYSYTKLAPDVEVLLTGGLEGNMMPQSWVRITEDLRVFYSRYDPDDLKKDEACRQMVVNALFWAADRKVLKK